MNKPIIDSSLMETKKHGTAAAPLKFYDSTAGLGDEYGTHWHRELEIVYLKEGNLLFRVNHKDYSLTKGDFIVISRGELHSFVRGRLVYERVVFESLLYSIDMLSTKSSDYCQNHIIENIENGSLSITRHIRYGDQGYDGIKSTFSKLKEIYSDEKPNYVLLMKAHLYEMLYHIVGVGITDLKMPKDKTLYVIVSRAIDYIHNHLSEQIRVSELAELTGYAENYFMSVFKQNTGMTCIEFINKERLKKAKVLLTESDQTIDCIASTVGFQNTGHFTKLFKKAFATTPHQFRISMRQVRIHRKISREY